ncbi:MAG: phosphodiester glycosidase family protein [Clostridiales bacterium]|nr:phosphodiester glycosidase family protein [Clostridiales bacterium]
MNFIRKKYVWAVMYGLALTGFTAYTLLDTFVIKRVYQPVSVETEAIASAETESPEITTESPSVSAGSENKPSHAPDSRHGGKKENKTETTTEISDNALSENSISELMPMTSAVISENSYSDKNFTITVTEYRTNDTSVYVGDITVNSADFIKTAFAENAYGKNITEKTSDLAASNNAFLAINGDYYGAREEGYVLRNGVLYRNTAADNQEDLVIYGDGSLEIINENEVTAEELLNNGAWQVWSFGPGLLEKGEITVTEEDEVGKAKASNPRTAIGIIDSLHYVFVVSDGRTDESEGLTLYELAEFMRELGVKTAYNLDGGGSSVMYFNGTVVNKPTTNGKTIKERSVSDIVYIGY